MTNMMLVNSSDQFNESWDAVGVIGRVPTARHAHTLTLHDHHLYLFGGYGVGGVHLGDLYKFDLIQSKWSRIKVLGKPVPTPRHSHTCVAYDGSLWIFGGIGKGIDNNVYNDLFRYDIQHDKWELIEHVGPVVPSGRWGHTSTVYNDTMLVFGGMNDISFFNHVLSFNFKTRQWSHLVVRDTTLNPPPHGRQYHGSVVVKDKLYIFGGYDGVVCPQDIFELDLNTLLWRGIVGNHVRRRGAICLGYNDKIYMFGGRNKDLSDTLHCFDPATLNWAQIPLQSRPSERQFSAGAIYDDSIWVFGGQSREFNENDIHRYRFVKKKPSTKEGDGFLALVDNPLFSDIKFLVEDKIIHAHKCILISNDHFKAMVMCGMKESAQDCITIRNVSYECFKAILCFIYTGHLIFKNVNIVELLELSDRYLVKEVKNECCKYMVSLLNPTNIEQMRRISDTFNLTELQIQVDILDAKEKLKENSINNNNNNNNI